MARSWTCILVTRKLSGNHERTGILLVLGGYLHCPFQQKAESSQKALIMLFVAPISSLRIVVSAKDKGRLT